MRRAAPRHDRVARLVQPARIERGQYQPAIERVLRERSEENLTEADFVTGDVGAKGRRGDIEAEGRFEEIARRVDLLNHRVAQVEIADRPKPAHCDGAATVESAV